MGDSVKAARILLDLVGAVWLAFWFRALDWETRAALSAMLVLAWFVISFVIHKLLPRHIVSPSDGLKRRFVRFGSDGEPVYKFEGGDEA